MAAKSIAVEAGIGTMRPPAHTNQQLRTIDIYCEAAITHRDQRVCSVAPRSTFHALKSLLYVYTGGRNECLES